MSNIHKVLKFDVMGRILDRNIFCWAAVKCTGLLWCHGVGCSLQRANTPGMHRIRLLVHQSQAGGVIGKAGSKIKELREVFHLLTFTVSLVWWFCHQRYSTQHVDRSLGQCATPN